MDRLVLSNIEDLPEAEGLETPLHPKRKRMWKLSNSGPSSPRLLRTSECPSSPCSSVSSLATFVKCEASPTPSTSTMQPSPSWKYLGSDDDSDREEDEETIMPIIPKVFSSVMETPVDNDEEATIEVKPAVVDNTEQPWGLYHFDWKPFPNPPIPEKLRREEFLVNNAGPTITTADPYEIFTNIWDQRIMDHIAAQTNKYAQEVASQMLQNHELHPKSRISQWYDTTVDELYVFFGIILAMGVVVKTRIEEYWGGTPDIFYTPGFSAHMSVNRFLVLSKCLYFNDNDDICELNLSYSEARLFKIQPLLSHLSEKFQALYIPLQNLSVNESLLKLKNWLEINQVIPNKTAQKGIKTYELIESQTGYLWRFEICSHKKSPVQSVEDPLDAFTPSIVLQLVKGLEYKGYTLWMDNFYHSPCLARRLKCLGFDCAGTLRTDREFVPQTLKALTKENMCHGQITGLTAGDVDVMVWRDTNRVAMISTYHGNEQKTVRESTKPILITDYNIMMGGVYKKDQLLANYPIEKRTKVWYDKLFRRFLNISVLNSYIIHKKNSLSKHSLSHRSFSMNLIKFLLLKHSTPSPILPVIKQKKVDVSHRLAEFPISGRQRIRRKCSVCKKLVQTFCVACSKTVCMEPCFLKLHS